MIKQSEINPSLQFFSLFAKKASHNNINDVLVGASGVVVELSSVEPSFGIFSSAIGQNGGHVTITLCSDWLKGFILGSHDPQTGL